MKRAVLVFLALLFASPAFAQFPNPQFVPDWNNHGRMALVPPYPGDHLKLLRGDGSWAVLGTLNAPAGSSGQIQYNAGGVFGATSLPSSGILKGGPGPAFLNAVAGTDYLAPNGNGSGLIGLLASQIGSVPDGVLKGSSGAFVAATDGADYLSSATGVKGPVSSTSGNIPTFSGTTGRLLQDSGKNLPAGSVVGTSDAQALTFKDLTGTGNTFPILNQNTAGSAAKWTTPRNLAGNSVDGSANVAFANKFIVQGTADAGLSGAQFLGALGTCLLKNTTTTGVLSCGASSTDYAPATSGSSLLKGNGSGGFSNAASGTDYAPATSGSAIQKGNGAGGLSAAVAGTDYVAPGGSAGAIDVTTQAVDNNTTKAASTAFVLGQAASATPIVDGSAAVGTSTRYARADHVHPTDTSRAAVASPTFTGTPAAPTAAVDTNTAQLATAAFVLGQAASATPLAPGTAAVGTSTRYARGDHVHPTDTTRAATSTTVTGTGSITGGGDLSANRTLAYSGDGAWSAYTPTLNWVTVPTTYSSTIKWKSFATKSYDVRINITMTDVTSCSAGNCGPVYFTFPNSVTPTGDSACAFVDNAGVTQNYYAEARTTGIIFIQPANSTWIAGRKYNIKCSGVEVN